MLSVNLEILSVECKAGKQYRVRINGCLGPPDETVFDARYEKSEHESLRLAGEMLGDFIRRAGNPVAVGAAKGLGVW